MGKIKVEEFDIRYTTESGQPLTFFGDFSEEGRKVEYVSNLTKFEVEQHRNFLQYSSFPKIGDIKTRKEIEKRFGLRHDMNKIYQNIATDPFLIDSIQKYHGMRITQNDPWETTVCFVMSQFNNVRRIRGIVKKLIEVHGEKKVIDIRGKEITFKDFPTPQTFSDLSIKEIMKCGTGFRGKYIKGISERVIENGFDFYKLERKKYDYIKEELMTLPGIGDKVADCILLMGYEKLEAFPIDTWIKKIVEKLYFKGKKQSIKTIHSFAIDRWGEDAGYAQQYLFHNARINKLKT